MDRGDMSSASVDVKDIQGIVRFGFGPLKDASFWLLKIRDAAAARAWLATAPVTTAEKLSMPPHLSSAGGLYA